MPHSPSESSNTEPAIEILRRCVACIGWWLSHPAPDPKKVRLGSIHYKQASIPLDRDGDKVSAAILVFAIFTRFADKNVALRPVNPSNTVPWIGNRRFDVIACIGWDDCLQVVSNDFTIDGGSWRWHTIELLQKYEVIWYRDWRLSIEIEGRNFKFDLETFASSPLRRAWQKPQTQSKYVAVLQDSDVGSVPLNMTSSRRDTETASARA